MRCSSRCGGAFVEPLLQARVVLGLRQVHAAVVQQLGETRELRVVRLLGFVDIGETLADVGAVLGVAALVARDGEDAAAVGQLAVAEGLEQGRHQLAPGEVTGAAEKNKIEGHGV